MYIDKDKLINDLSNFYIDYGYDQESISHIFDTYIKAATLIENYILGIKDNTNIAKIETYRVFPYKVASTQGATYTYETLLYDKVVVDKLSLSGKSLDERKVIWLALDDQNKKDILLTKGYYIPLTAKRDIDLKEYKIIDMEVYTLKNELLARDSDYILSENKLFLIGDAALPSIYNSKLILKNIYVDYDIPQTYIGKSLGIPYNEIITKPEYRDFMQMLVYASLGGPTIKNIKNAFDVLAGWKNVDIVDLYSAKGYKKDLWGGSGNSIELTPFSFLINIPIEYFSNEDKITLFRQFLNIIKPAHTDYMIAWSQHISDSLDDLNDPVQISLDDSINETLTATDEVQTKSYQKDSYSIELQQSEVVIVEFDAEHPQVIFDNKLQWDLSPQLIRIEGAQGYGDVADVKHITFPEIPLNFTAARSVMTGEVTISFKDNAANITRYEILRNDIIIMTTTGTGGGNTITLVDSDINNQPSGEYEYYARSVYEIDPNYPEFTKYSAPSAKVIITK